MSLQFTAAYTAEITERWCVEAPTDWDQMSESQQHAWLRENLISAECRSHEIDDVEERTILDCNRI